MKQRVIVDTGPLVALHPQSAVLTLDNDFSVYRKNGRQVIQVLTP